MKKVVLALAIASLWTGAAVAAIEEKPAAAAEARGVTDPRAFVAAQYVAYQTPATEPIQWPTYAFSDRLRSLFDAYDAWARQHEDLVGSLDFDWWVNAQDWILSNVQVSETARSAERRTVSARFTNAGRSDEVRFLFVRQGERWFLDDAIEGTGSGDGGWTLSALLQERPE